MSSFRVACLRNRAAQGHPWSLALMFFQMRNMFPGAFLFVSQMTHLYLLIRSQSSFTKVQIQDYIMAANVYFNIISKGKWTENKSCVARRKPPPPSSFLPVIKKYLAFIEFILQTFTQSFQQCLLFYQKNLGASFMRHLIVSRIQGADVVVCPMFIIMKGWAQSLSHNFLRVHSRVVRHENNDHMSWCLLDSYSDLKETHRERTVWTPPASPLLQWLLCFRPRLRER